MPTISITVPVRRTRRYPPPFGLPPGVPQLPGSASAGGNAVRISVDLWARFMNTNLLFTASFSCKLSLQSSCPLSSSRMNSRNIIRSTRTPKRLHHPETLAEQMRYFCFIRHNRFPICLHCGIKREIALMNAANGSR